MTWVADDDSLEENASNLPLPGDAGICKVFCEDCVLSFTTSEDFAGRFLPRPLEVEFG